MSHFNVWVVGDVDASLEPYDENKEMPPHKQYMAKDDLARMKEYYKTDDEMTLIDKMPDWCGCEGGKDKKGLFYFTTSNENAKWDWYEIGGRWEGDITRKDGTFTTGTEIKNIDFSKTSFPYALVVNGEWHEKGRVLWFGITDDKISEKKWKTHVKKILAKMSKESFVTVVDCHI